MLNIYPINHNTNVNFKSQRDFSRIYKEMEKITLTREEKVKPKLKSSDIVDKFKSKYAAKISAIKIANIKSNFLQYLKKKGYNLSDLKDDLETFGLLAFYIGTIAGAIGLSVAVPMRAIKSERSSDYYFPSFFHKYVVSENDFVDDTNTKTDAFNQADVLENLYNQGSITLAEYKQEMQKVIDTYDVNAHMELFAQEGIYPDAITDKNALKEQYYHDEAGNLVARIKNDDNDINGLFIRTSQGYDLITDIDCSDVDNNINILKDKVSQVEADETSAVPAAVVNDSIVNAKTDSLINLYQNKTISFDEFKTSINQLHKEQ